MLIGEYEHIMDFKGRLNFPVKLRNELGDCFIITRGFDCCLNVYSIDEWNKLENSLCQLPRNKRRLIERFIFSGACEVVPDKQGRILISANLREYACLHKEVKIIGASDHVEIWSAAQWQIEFEKFSPENVSQIMSEIDF